MGVSRETQDRLTAYSALIVKWTKRINLVAPSTIATLWTRHIEDSRQVYESVLAHGHWADLGTGAGLPGLVVAILAAEAAPDLKVTLVESDRRKATFCRTVIRELGLRAEVRADRIEAIPPLLADIVSARALAPLDVLLHYAERHLAQDGVAVFPKGAGWQKEIDEALASWRFRLEKETSRTESSAVILKIGDLARV